MARHPQTDNFEGTKMTFGEHIEELRTALFQAILGLAIGVVLGFMCATWVVNLIKTPLENALRTYYLEKAQEELSLRYDGAIPLEMMTIISEEGLAPDKIRVSPEGLIEAIQRASSGTVENFRYTPHRIDAEELLPGRAKDLAAAWIAKAGADDDSPEAALWKLLAPPQQQTLERLARADAPTEKDATAVAAVLDDLAARPALHEADALHALEADDARVQATLQELRAKSAQPGGLSDNDSRRLNRVLLTAVFPDAVRKPRVALVELPIWKPMDVKVVALGAQEAFMIWMKAAFITGLVISAPWVFWKIWEFVAAGLYPHEKNYVFVYLPISLILFFSGAALAFFFVFEPVLAFFFKFNKSMNIDPDPRISEWLSFVLFMPLGFGISFQLPLVMLFLQRIGIFTVDLYLSKWRIAILAIFVISMVLTPSADPISMLMMACPLSVLYFGGLAMCIYMPKGRNPYSELQAYEP